MARPAVHRTIVVVDVAGFGDHRRTNLHQLAVRDSLYAMLALAFDRSGIRWADCDNEDRGDGVLIVVPPSVTKSVLVESLPDELTSALREHNRTHAVEEQIRLRVAVHAGEIHYDDHGVVGRAVNLAFRLLDAAVFKEVLARSTSELAIITSAWFFEEVVWHAANRAEYQQVRVAVKETDTTAWIRVPGSVPDVVPAPERPHPVPQQLPARTRQFVGRREELDVLTRLLGTASGDAGTVIITAIDGTAGIGKTALALFWAHQVKDHFPDGQLHVNLRGFDPQAPMDAGQALHGFLIALGVAPSAVPSDLDAKAALYRTLVAGKRMLILLDNARSTDHVRPLLPGTASCLVIITSRNRLASLAVHEGAHQITLDLLSTSDAKELVAKRVNRVTDEEATAELVELCARLPLALSIVAARAGNRPLRQLVQELRDERGRLDALDLGHTDLDLRAVFSWSYAVLSPQAARLFRLLGVHPGPDIDHDACAALAGDPTPLRELIRAHLIEEHAPRRYRFHDLLRAYASDRAAHDEPEREAALRRVLDHYVLLASHADGYIQPCRDGSIRTPTPAGRITSYRSAMEWFTAEIATLLAALNCAAGNGFDSHASRIAWACTIFLRRSGQRFERAEAQRIAVAATSRAGDRRGYAYSLRQLANAIARLGQHDDALAFLAEALSTYRELDDEEGQIQTHLSYARVFERLYLYSYALEHAQHAWRIARGTDNRLHHADALTSVGHQQTSLGHYTEALPLCEEALALYESLPHPEGEADALANLGHLKQCLGQYEDAIACYQRALAIDRQLGDLYWEAFTLNQLGDAHEAIGDTSRAGLAWSQALCILDELRLPDAEEVRTKLTRQATG
jgi:tetratricopeptide (TPR) repeat protein